MKLAYADVQRYDADPRTCDVPVAALLSKDYARKRAALIDPKKANCDGGAGRAGRQRHDLSDRGRSRDGNIASWIQSIYGEFGSGVTVEGMGFVLQNRGAGFHARTRASQRARGRQAAVPHHHSRLHGAGRSAHRLRHHGRGEPAAGARAVCFEHRRLRHEHAAGAGSAAVHQDAAPTDATCRSNRACRRRRCSSSPSAAIRSRIRREYTQEMGRGQAILHNSTTGTNYAASDPRADGAAVPEPIRP